MITVLRNGNYEYTEELEFGDIIVPPRPHENAQYIDNRWLVDVDEILTTVSSKDGLSFLNATDWKVIRHRDQLALDVETSLTTEGFQELLQQRQDARDKVEEGKNDNTSNN